MPPRTTQKSCKAWPLRQKSQIEPWLAHRPQILLVGVSVWHRQFDADTMCPTTPSAALLLLKAKDHRRRKGLNDENYLSPASRERCFLLTLPFIEPGTPCLIREREKWEIGWDPPETCRTTVRIVI